METNEQQTQFQNFQVQRPLPNATAVLVLGIIGIVGCFCSGLPGIICSIISLVLYKKDKTLYTINPELYTAESYKNENTGRICAIIGLSISVLSFIFSILYFVFVFWAASSNPEAIKHAFGQ
jgi:hypothetical protein